MQELGVGVTRKGFVSKGGLQPPKKRKTQRVGVANFLRAPSSKGRNRKGAKQKKEIAAASQRERNLPPARCV